MVFAFANTNVAVSWYVLFFKPLQAAVLVAARWSHHGFQYDLSVCPTSPPQQETPIIFTNHMGLRVMLKMCLEMAKTSV